MDAITEPTVLTTRDTRGYHPVWVLFETEPGGGEHGIVSMTVGAQLHSHVRAHGLGWAYGAETGFVLAHDPDTVRAPDASFVRKERGEAVARTTKYIEGPPDLAVEVKSPSNRPGEVEEKTRAWLAAGCAAVVVLDPRTRTGEIHRVAGVTRLSGSDVLDLTDVVTGWSLPLAPLFE